MYTAEVNFKSDKTPLTICKITKVTVQDGMLWFFVDKKLDAKYIINQDVVSVVEKID